jgi:hypothetical protein
VVKVEEDTVAQEGICTTVIPINYTTPLTLEVDRTVTTTDFFLSRTTLTETTSKIKVTDRQACTIQHPFKPAKANPGSLPDQMPLAGGEGGRSQQEVSVTGKEALTDTAAKAISETTTTPISL